LDARKNILRRDMERSSAKTPILKDGDRSGNGSLSVGITLVGNEKAGSLQREQESKRMENVRPLSGPNSKEDWRNVGRNRDKAANESRERAIAPWQVWRGDGVNDGARARERYQQIINSFMRDACPKTAQMKVRDEKPTFMPRPIRF